ncbi:hypothetical protein F5884DRAFT_258903 [Xylogone sp. PMI_703]|nr:hypothetical protein F5884DRAFT_258903 [Xylogone sp. PMI_703]
MSFDAATLQFFTRIRLDDQGQRTGTWFEEQLLEELPRLASQAPWPSSPSGCPLADMGNYVVRVLHILATAAENLLSGDFISRHIDERMDDLVAEDDLHTADFLDNKHAALKEISRRLNQALRDCENSWSFVRTVHDSAARPILDPPTDSPLRSVAHSENSISQSRSPSATHVNSFLRSPMADEHDLVGYSESYQGPAYPSTLGAYPSNHPGEVFRNTESGGNQHFSTNFSPGDESQSGASLENASESIDWPLLLERLKSRGTGRHTCPQGRSCKKGGVQPNGELTVWTRNSAFRTHILLHVKMFKCDLPGCTNTKGFARIDQLERHKKTVQHIPPGNVYFQPHDYGE